MSSTKLRAQLGDWMLLCHIRWKASRREDRAGALQATLVYRIIPDDTLRQYHVGVWIVYFRCALSLPLYAVTQVDVHLGRH